VLCARRTITLRDLEQAKALLRRHPEFPNAQVYIKDKLEVLYSSSTTPFDAARSPARAEIMKSFFDIHAAAYLRLVDDISLHEAYSYLLNDIIRETWGNYTKTSKAYFHSEASMDAPFVSALTQRAQYWETEGYRRIAAAHEAAKVGTPSNVAQPLPSIGEVLDELALTENISHDEQANRIGVSRSIYFDVKAGRGKKKALAKAKLYIGRVLSGRSDRKPD
jgi:hypothetical protein